MQGAKHYESATGSDLRLRQGVVIVNAPLVHVSGVFRVVQAVLDGRRIALLERFTVDAWADAVRRHHPKTVSLVPTALRMVLDADVAPDVFDSVRSVVSGTAPLDPDLADAFTARYGVPVLTSYGATEFGGGVAGWNLADHQRYGREKRGSVGRAHAGCELRIVDPERGTALGVDEVGVLEVRAAQLATDEWVRTTDLARLDADGFLWILGRADQTILRGGYKIQPETVRAALEHDPAVREAAVVGIRDDRLGAVPVAAVEREPGMEVDEAALLELASGHLAPYEMPVAVSVLDELPRTESGKADLAAVRALFDDVVAARGA
jgi:acyl-coenzyme A synthetase/AMP-(fatty) acid ligase